MINYIEGYMIMGCINQSISFSTTNVKNMHLHLDSNPGHWNTVPML